MILARLKTAAYKASSAPRKLAEVVKGTGCLYVLDNGGGLQTPEGKHQKRFDDQTNWKIASRNLIVECPASVVIGLPNKKLRSTS